MSALRELQADVLRALVGRTNRAAQHVLADGIDPRRRLEIHRHNLLASLTEALKATYPTVARLVGTGFFRYAAHEYIAAHPPATGNVHDFGAALPEFLAGFAPAASLPYLADVARLEWAWHAVFHSEATRPIDAGQALRRVAEVPSEQRPGLRLRMQPAARLLASRYPVCSIWRANLQDDPPPVDLSSGCEQALVAQHEGEVAVIELSVAEHALLQALARHEPLGAALEAALRIDPGHDAAATIARHFALGTLTDIDDGGAR